MAVIYNLMSVVVLALLLFFTLLVALVDPREPTDSFSRFGMGLGLLLGVLPLLLIWAPASALYNASLALALSTIISPLLFGAMKTDSGSEWIQDKLFVAIARLVFAGVLALPLSYFDAWWFLVLASLTLFSFMTRLPLWLSAGGKKGSYLLAVTAAALLMAVYYLLVDSSELTPETWLNWHGFLT